MKTKLILLAFSINAMFAQNFIIKETDNKDEVLRKIQYSYQRDAISSRSYTPIHINEFDFNATRDNISSIYDSNNSLLFYLVHNKIQNDPTLNHLKFKLNKDILSETTGYACGYTGGNPTCSAKQHFESVLYASNTVAAWLRLTNYPSNDNQIVLFNRGNTKRGNTTSLPNANHDYADNPMQGRDYMKVYVDADGKLTIRFALFNGNYTHIKTPKAIPLNTDVYIQANNSGTDYQVGWKILDGNSSVASGGHQSLSIPWDIEEHKRNNATVIQVDILKAFAPMLLLQKYHISKYYWNIRTDMFKNMNTANLTNKWVYQYDTTLNLNVAFINKILTDLANITNYFPLHKLRIFINDSGNVLAVDVREHY